MQEKWDEKVLSSVTSNQTPVLGVRCSCFPSHLRLFKDQVTLMGGLQRKPAAAFSDVGGGPLPVTCH